jgi:hypothetical protein
VNIVLLVFMVSSSPNRRVPFGSMLHAVGHKGRENPRFFYSSVLGAIALGLFRTVLIGNRGLVMREINPGVLAGFLFTD